MEVSHASILPPGPIIVNALPTVNSNDVTRSGYVATYRPDGVAGHRHLIAVVREIPVLSERAAISIEP
jgi:hypothetical protein